MINTNRKNKAISKLDVSHQSFTSALSLFYLYHEIMSSRGSIIEAPPLRKKYTKLLILNEF